MDYNFENYLSKKCPEFNGSLIESAIPNYFEDMKPILMEAEFSERPKINPEYNNLEYPIKDTCPDMTLPNILGNFFYKKVFDFRSCEGRPFIYFGGVKNAVSVWLNGMYLGRHEGYSTPFELEIPDGVLKEGDNLITLSVSNHELIGFDDQPISGITSRAASLSSGGVTDNIELRIYTSPIKDVSVLISKDTSSVSVNIDSFDETAEYTWKIFDEKKLIKSGKCNSRFSFDSTDLQKWSPEDPKLYILRVEYKEAYIDRHFGVRRFNSEGIHFKLNGYPYYLRGICEHCYYPKSINPSHDISYYKNIIGKFKELGFNFIRFHTHIPPKEYMMAADELGILIQVEVPNNTTYKEWCDIVKFCKRHTSVVIYCGGNELQIHDKYIAHLEKCADLVHENTDSLFSPMSALRGFEYAFENEPEKAVEMIDIPFRHNPRRFKLTDKFSDLYNSYALGHFSYKSQNADVEAVNSWSSVYKKPRVTHEICIDGTYTDLKLEERYKDLRIGKETKMFSSIRRHLADKGVLDRSDLYFKNSCQWQRRVRKYCFEAVRRCENIAGFDFLGPIDTHWHTFGYDVGMMNEFYEMKPSETPENVLRYNSESIILSDLQTKSNFASKDRLITDISLSYWGKEILMDASLTVTLLTNDSPIFTHKANISDIIPGTLTKIYHIDEILPNVENPVEMKLSITLEKDRFFAENEWELYLFPQVLNLTSENLIISDGMSKEELSDLLAAGKRVVIFGTAPFSYENSSFRIALAGRTKGHLATAINPHPVLKDMPHEGFCSLQFAPIMRNGAAIILEGDKTKCTPIVEAVTTHKNFIREAFMFEYGVEEGKLFVCAFNMNCADPVAAWLKSEIIKYTSSDAFAPTAKITIKELSDIINPKVILGAENTNFAINQNDKTANVNKKINKRK